MQERETWRDGQPAADPYDLDRVLYQFNALEPFTIRQACEGVAVFGGIGSGKTSGSGAALAKSYLRAGFGGLVLCAKNDELETWQRYAEATGRSDALLVFDGSGKHRFNFLQYETGRPGVGAGNTNNLMRLFMSVHEAINRRKGSSGEAYWQNAMEQLIRNALDLALIATGEVSIPTLHQIVMSAPTSPEQAREQAVKEREDMPLCWQLIDRASERIQSGELGEWEIADQNRAARYWLDEFPRMGEKQRAGIVSMFTSMADSFLSRPFRQLFCSDITLVPDLSLNGAIIVMNLPVKEYGDSGRAAQVMFKYIWQQAVERRDVRENPIPAFLWVDEAQNFATDYDMQFQATARSSRACTVYMTQNLPNYYAEMGGDHSKYRVDSLVGNLITKIWHANSDPATNLHAADTIGQSWQKFEGGSIHLGGMHEGQSSTSMGSSYTWNRAYDVEPQTFTTLRKGGPPNNFQVDAIIFQSGREWSNGQTYLPATFDQRDP